MPGYSGTSLAAKLGFKEGMRIVLQHAPEKYQELVAPVPCGVWLTTRLSTDIEMLHVFATNRRRLDAALRAAVRRLRPDGIIWVSWPKKASRQPTDIVEDTVREIALPLGLVDTKVCAIDAVWSGLKLVIRKSRRAPRQSVKATAVRGSTGGRGT